MEEEYPCCGFLLCADFNRLNNHRLTTQFQLKQLVDKPTRGDQILDSVITNLPQLYDTNSVQTLPLFGLSDHKVIFVRPKVRPAGKGSSRKTVSRRDTRASRKFELGRYVSSIDWSLFNRADSCLAKLCLFVDTIHIGMDHIMPVKHHKIHVNDALLITAEFKNLIRQRQQALKNGNKESYSLYLNAVNRERKLLRSKYSFASKVDNLKSTKPSQWWNAVKRIAGMVPCTSSDSFLSSLHLEDEFSELEIANKINSAFLAPMEIFQPLEAVALYKDDSYVTLSEPAVLAALKQLNPRKAAGPDCVPNWLLREYDEVLVQPVTEILNSSYKQQRLPPPWKLTDVVPIPEQVPVEDLSKQLRPISLTPAISKLAEDFVVSTHVGPVALKIKINMVVSLNPPPCLL